MWPVRDNPDKWRVILANARDGALELAESVVKLAQVELRRDMGQLGAQAAQGALFAAMVLAGYCFVVVAACFGLSSLLPVWATLLAFGVVHVGVGLWGLRRFGQRVQDFKPMQLTTAEITKSVASLKGTLPSVSSTELVAFAPALSVSTTTKKTVGHDV